MVQKNWPEMTILWTGYIKQTQFFFPDLISPFKDILAKFRVAKTLMRNRKKRPHIRCQVDCVFRWEELWGQSHRCVCVRMFQYGPGKRREGRGVERSVWRKGLRN